MVKVCVLIFATSRYEYLIPSLDSLKEHVDFSGAEVYKILTDDYPLRRDNDMLDMIEKEYQIDKVVRNKENIGYSGSWANAWKIIPDDVDYIWHQEEDFVFEGNVKILDMIKTFEESPIKLSQLFLKRNPWYSHDGDFVNLIADGKIGKEVESNGHTIVAFKHRWFVPHPGIYPAWISREKLPSNPQEDVVFQHLNKYHPELHSAVLGSAKSKYMVKHIGDYNQGKRYSDNDPGSKMYSKYDSTKKYVSSKYLTEFSDNTYLVIAHLCDKKGWKTLYNKYMEKSKEEETQLKLKQMSVSNLANQRHVKYQAFLTAAEQNKESSRIILLQATEICPERLEAWYKLMMSYIDVKDWAKAYGYGVCGWPNCEKYKYTEFPNKENSIYNYLFVFNFSMAAYYAGYVEESLKIAKKFDHRVAPQRFRDLHNGNMRFYTKGEPSVTSSEARTLQCKTPTVMIIDNFLPDPNTEREFALAQTYEVAGNYPGKRTKCFATLEDKKMLENILGKQITYWPGEYNGSYQYCFENMKSWIHRDKTTHSAILFLTPNPKYEAGTTLYVHKATNKTYRGEVDEDEIGKDGSDLSKWIATDVVGNKYNRLAIFNGMHSHSSTCYFGDSLETSRLFKIFFFNIED